MNLKKSHVWTVLVLLLTLVGVTTACGLLPTIYTDNPDDGRHISCDVPPAAGQSLSLDAINISLNIDGSESMPGYLANGRGRYIETIKLLDRTFSLDTSGLNSSVEYYRIGGFNKEKIGRSVFLEAIEPGFYYDRRRVTSELAAAITPPKEGKELLVLITDLYQNEGDVTKLNKKIAENYLNQNRKGYAAGILAIRSEFEGRVFVVGSRGNDYNFSYDTEGKPPEKFRPFYVIFLGPYQHILHYFEKLKRDGGESIANSEFTIFSPNNIVSELSVIGEPKDSDKPIPGLSRPSSLNNGRVAIELPRKQPIELLEITDSSQEEIPINYQVNLPTLNEYTLPPSRDSIQAQISESEFFDDSTKEFRSSSLPNSMEFSNWKVDGNNELSFTTTIKPGELPQPNVYFFQVDVVANGLGEQDWWQEWNWNEGIDGREDGWKTHNLDNFLLGLKSITTDLMADNPLQIARFCYAVQKN